MLNATVTHIDAPPLSHSGMLRSGTREQFARHIVKNARISTCRFLFTVVPTDVWHSQVKFYRHALVAMPQTTDVLCHFLLEIQQIPCKRIRFVCRGSAALKLESRGVCGRGVGSV